MNSRKLNTGDHQTTEFLTEYGTTLIVISKNPNV